ncbi:alpha/beta hydrolase [Adhaeribacter pallidiroseus]|uniref:Ferri-bacillibactin esterase BesA n=1 Tax=Adhaeribacter pallidiroseus TaxID=2072847 RepID=A0A369QP22_9BACT|nr:alpha/beta hydrolase-fold protein [Adhaeribacter pallidiroseus]RDC65026.1 Ferri-bacillibactin esterase BesA [Adhaeribacter pallidiroseus]
MKRALLNLSSLLVFLFFIIFLSPSFAQNNTTASNVLTVAIAGTQQLKLTSKIILGQEYSVQVNLPGHYSDTSKKFPVIYLLDSQWDFPLVSGIYGGQYYDGFMPEAIIVGITWGGENPNYGQLRARDFTPTNLGQGAQFGNAANFLTFIQQELTPFIEANYRVSKNNRTLMGSSLGGLFTLYALFKAPDFFQNYVLTSPATPWDQDVIYKIEQEYWDKNKTLPVRLYMATGDAEDVAIFNKWVNTVKGRKYTGLNLQTKVLENIGHSGTKPIGYTQGLQWVFKKTPVSLTATQLKPYVGTYLLDKEVLKIVIENNALVGIDAQNHKTVLAAETEKDFFVPGRFLFLHFQKDQANQVAGFQLEQFEGVTFAKKKE